MNSQKSLFGLDRQHLSPVGELDESPINYILLHELVSTVIHTENINNLNPPEFLLLGEQHKSASFPFIYS